MLTTKQESYKEARLNGSDPSEAYRLAYDAIGMSAHSVGKAAYVLEQHPAIAPLIAEGKQALVAETQADRAYVIKKAMRNVDAAYEDKQYGASNGALNTIVDVQGLKITKIEATVTHTLQPGLSLEELEARIQRLDVLEAGVIEGEVVDKE